MKTSAGVSGDERQAHHGLATARWRRYDALAGIKCELGETFLFGSERDGAMKSTRHKIRMVMCDLIGDFLFVQKLHQLSQKSARQSHVRRTILYKIEKLRYIIDRLTQPLFDDVLAI